MINKSALIAHKKLHGDCSNLGDISKIEKLPKVEVQSLILAMEFISIAVKEKEA